jgi:hypothetical protein
MKLSADAISGHAYRANYTPHCFEMSQKKGRQEKDIYLFPLHKNSPKKYTE